jgi:hypothetical protein
MASWCQPGRRGPCRAHAHAPGGCGGSCGGGGAAGDCGGPGAGGGPQWVDGGTPGGLEWWVVGRGGGWGGEWEGRSCKALTTHPPL